LRQWQKAPLIGTEGSAKVPLVGMLKSIALWSYQRTPPRITHHKEDGAMNERAAKEYLLRNDERFQQLAAQHQQFEKKLSALTQRPFLTTDEQIEETVIKKKKLALKDQMHMLILQFREQDPVH
jgi:uncharacterized protein YdcH (DUF465 family)